MRNFKKVYIAGPEVFREDAKEIGEKYKQICQKYGFEGVYPLDSGLTNSHAIYKWDIGAIRECEIVVANLNPFRGKTMDDGTAFEIGWACSLCKKVYGYMSDMRSLRKRYGEKDADGHNYESFDLPINLMIAESVMIIEGDFEDCIRAMSGRKDIPPSTSRASYK